MDEIDLARFWKFGNQITNYSWRSREMIPCDYHSKNYHELHDDFSGRILDVPFSQPLPTKKFQIGPLEREGTSELRCDDEMMHEYISYPNHVEQNQYPGS